MERDLYEELLKWMDSDDRKPLIIRGVRQCGKTYLMEYFGENNYRSVAYCKFEGNPSLCRLFDGDLNADRLITALSIHLDIDIDPETLIIFDEIQECAHAMTSLKSFEESAPEYHIVCAGSLLGLQGSGSFPVGKVSFMDLRPMSFRELLRACKPRLYMYVMGSGTDNISRDRLESLLLEYMADIGILRCKAGIMASHIMEGRIDPLFQCGMMENHVMCELTSYGHQGEGYWISGNTAEVNYLITCNEGIVPIEVKSRKKYRAASLKEYIDKYNPKHAMVVSGKDRHDNDGTLTIPLYSVWEMFEYIDRS